MNKSFSITNILVALACLVLAFLIVAVPSIYILGPLFLLVLIILVSRNLIWGVYLMIFFFPFISLEINFGYGINLPIVDLVALVTFIAWLFTLLTRKEKSFQFPGLIFFLGFFLVAALSLTNVGELGSDQLGLSIKYLLRPLVFFYLMFVVLPFNTIKKEEQLKASLFIMYFLGLLVSVMGIVSLFFIKSAGLIPRAVPFGIAGIYPLGTNQNLIAETLVVIIPFAWILVKKATNWPSKFWLSLGLITMMAVNLLTFSRAGWIVLLLEVVLIAYYEYFHGRKINKKDLMLICIISLIVMIALGVMMYNLLNSPIVANSNRNRLELLRISVDTFLRHPIIGQGVGTFQQIVSHDPTYTREFGSALESHGFLQKIITETGLLGLIFFLLAIYYILRKAFSSFAKEQIYFFWGLIVVIVGAFIFQLFNTSYFVSKLWLPVGLSLTAINIYYPSLFKKNDK